MPRSTALKTQINAGLTVLLTPDPDGRAALRRALTGHRALPERVRVVLHEDDAVRFDGSLEEFCRRPDGTWDDPEGAFLRRLFAVDDLLPR
jgi:hypothetical protein